MSPTYPMRHPVGVDLPETRPAYLATLEVAGNEINKLQKLLDEKDLKLNAARELLLTCILEGTPTIERCVAVARALTRGVL